jgi:predicted DNA-binding protein
MNSPKTAPPPKLVPRTMSFQLSPQHYEDVKRFATERNMTISDVVRAALEQYLNQPIRASTVA